MQPYDSNEVFREVTQRICGSLDIEAALKDTLPYLATLMPADAVHLMVYDRHLQSVRTVALAAGRVPLPSAMIQRHQMTVPASLFEAAELLGPIINRPAEIPAFREVLRTVGVDRDMSTIALPLSPKNQRQTGVLTVMALGTDQFQPCHIELLTMLRVPLVIALTNALRYEEVVRLRDRLEEDNLALRKVLREYSDSIIGAGMGLRHVMELVEQVAPMDSPVLLFGETGSGKEVIANALHRLSPRRTQPMISVNCGAIPETLIDSELFGHEKGAFTGAINTKRGIFERADGGTVFLDEIGELPSAAQVKLLRVLQTMEFERVGGGRTLSVDLRVVAATHRNLQEMVASGRFREDLWYRLNVFPIRIPPLRERQEDIPLLAVHFAETRAREMNLPDAPVFAPEALDQLIAHDWPGNVRELRNVIERALILSRGRPLSFPALGPHECADAPLAPRVPTKVSTLDEAMTDHIRRVLAVTGGRIKGPGGAAALLGLPPSTLRNKMIRLGFVGNGKE